MGEELRQTSMTWLMIALPIIGILAGVLGWWITPPEDDESNATVP
jgi:hypothetical protein